MITIDVSLTLVTVKVRGVGPHINRQFQIALDADLPQKPERPMKTVKTADGREEETPFGKDSDEYQTWQIELQAWEILQRAALKESALRWNDLVEDYSIVAWKWHNTSEWCTDVPDDWQYPPELDRYGISPTDNRKLDYLRTDVLIGINDLELLYNSVIIADLEEKEVQLHLDGFRPEREQRRIGKINATVSNEHIREYVPRGNEHSTGSINIVRRLVRAVTGRKSRDGSATAST